MCWADRIGLGVVVIVAARAILEQAPTGSRLRIYVVRPNSKAIKEPKVIPRATPHPSMTTRTISRHEFARLGHRAFKYAGRKK